MFSSHQAVGVEACKLRLLFDDTRWNCWPLFLTDADGCTRLEARGRRGLLQIGLFHGSHFLALSLQSVRERKWGKGAPQQPKVKNVRIWREKERRDFTHLFFPSRFTQGHLPQWALAATLLKVYATWNYNIGIVFFIDEYQVCTATVGPYSMPTQMHSLLQLIESSHYALTGAICN